MNYLLTLPLLGLSLIQVVTWFGILPPRVLSMSLSIASIGVFLFGLISAQIFSSNTINDVVHRVFGNLRLKSFFIGLLLIIYFFFNFFYSSSKGGNTKIENGKYFALRQRPREYYEISKTEFDERQPHRVRAATGHALIFGIYGYFLFSIGRSNNAVQRT